ncbi:MAG: AAA family ATPase [Bacteroidales bacterium]|nr:AAA family ATPase [Bacteroidales bacterium]
MIGFKSIDIRNFRSVDHLKMDDLSRINVLVGQNNSGKSTVLEAIALSLGLSNPDMPQAINAIRARKPFSNFIDIKYFFNNLNVSVSPEITMSQTDGTIRHLSLGLNYVFDELADPKDEPIRQTGAVVYVNTLEMNFDLTVGTSKQRYKSWLRVNPAGAIVNRKIADGYMEQLRGWMISADFMSNNTVNDLTDLFKRNQKSVVLSLLRLFDSKINSIEILNDDVYIGFDGLSEMLPSRMTGDGLRRYLCIVASAANSMTNIIMLDEIDNGLHYSAYKKLWEALFTLAVSTNKQIFVTTHSKETLLKLNEMLEEHLEYQNELALYTLEQTKLKGHQAYRLPYEGLAEACKNNVEIRSIAL